MKLKLIALFSIFACIQTAAINYKLLESSNSGLSTTLINDIHQDSNGFLWVATEYGLNRYDGYKFTIYFEHNQERSINNNFTTKIFEDRAGNIWVGTISGIERWNKKLDTFEPIIIYDNNGNRISTSIHSFFQNNDDEIWVGSNGNGIFVIKPNDLSCARHKEINGLESTRITKIFQTNNNTILISAYTGGLFSYDGTNLSKIKSENGEDITCVEDIDMINNNIILGSTRMGLLAIIDGQVKTINNQLNIRDIYIHKSSSSLLIATDGSGIKKYNLNTLKENTTDNKFSRYFYKKKIHKIIEDSKSNLWAASFQHGLISIQNYDNEIKFHTNTRIKKGGIITNAISCIHINPNDVFFIGTDGDGLFTYDRKNNIATPVALLPLKPKAHISITSMYSDSDGSTWVSTYNHGLFIIDNNTNKIRKVKIDFQSICGVIEDNLGQIVVMTYGDGVYIIDKKTEKIVWHDIAYGWSNAYAKSSNGDIHICINSDIYILRKVNGQPQISQVKGFNNITAKTAFVDSNNVLWIGSRSGLFMKNKSGQISNLASVFPELLNRYIYSINEDLSGNLWISSTNSIYKLNKTRDNLTNYNRSTGLQISEFSACSFRDRKNNMYFGGTNGFIEFQTETIKEIKPKIDLKIIGINTALSSLNDINNQKKFVFSYKERNLDISVSTFSVFSSDNTYYHYRLNNKSTGENTSLGNNILKLTNVHYGNNKLEIVAISPNGRSKPSTYYIWIKYPWYFQWWAILIYILFFLITIYLIYREINNRILDRRALQYLRTNEMMNDEKLKFFINLSHEIKTPLSMIIGPLSKLVTTKNGDEYKMMYRNAKNISNIIDELMAIQKIDKGALELNKEVLDIVPIINDIITTLSFHAEQNNQSISIKVKQDAVYANIDKFYFERIIVNLLSNSIKYAGNGSSIKVAIIVIPNENVKIIVQDDGAGIPEEHLPHIFKRFYNGSSSGTGVGLNLTKSLVELHEGSIRAENRAEVTGARFIILLPYIERPILPINQDEVSLTNEIGNPNIGNNTIKSSAIEATNSERSSIMIVDDDPEIRNYLQFIFQPNYSTVFSENGKDALILLKTIKPDLIISDIMMPEMDGITFIQKVKQSSRLKQIPVIMLTAKNKVNDQLEGLKYGIDAYIAKPFNQLLLETTVKNLLIKKKEIKQEKLVDIEYAENIEKIQMPSGHRKFLDLVNHHINDNLENPDFNINELSEKLDISRMQLLRKMKEITNLTAKEYLVKIRMTEAARLIELGEFSISEIAYKVGYNSPSHFSTAYKAYYGHSPKISKKPSAK